MRKLSLLLGVLALTIGFVACDRNENKPPIDEIVEDGFYVVGAAVAVADLNAEGAAKAIMAVGINENDEQSVRDGMYEKYIALEGGKSFQLVLKEGVKETVYGATLTEENLAPEGESVEEQPLVTVYKGKMAENATLQVPESGLYHIVLDLNLDSKLSDKLILISPVELGVRGDMNGWGFTAFDAPEFNKTTMTYTLADVTVESKGGAYKFAYGGGWKIELNSGAETVVKANTNLGMEGDEEPAVLVGNKLKPGGKNIAIDPGVYTIKLRWTLAQGDVKESFAAEMIKTGDVDVPDYPETLFINGGDFGGENWSWDSEGIVSMVPVHSHPHVFWAIVYVSEGGEFKMAPKKEWAGGFGKAGDATNGVYSKGGDNIKVDDAGYYMVYVDLKDEKISVTAPEVYLMGKSLGDDDSVVWAYANPDGKFTVDNTTKKITSPAFANGGELRMYATCPFSQLGDDPVDWWQSEFIVLGGKIVYRGTGGDQERVSVTAGQKVSLDFQAGTGAIQ